MFKFNKSVNVKDLVDYLNKDFVGGCSVEDFDKGSGVYGIEVGSRGYIEDIFKVDNFKSRSKMEMLNDMLKDIDNDKDKEDFLKYEEEFVDSGEIDWNDFGGYYEGLSEECSMEFYNVEV